MRRNLRQYLVSVITDQVKRPRDEVIKFLLLLVSFFYRLVVGLISLCYRTRLFRPHRVNRCLLSVGNLTWGGTGKTPLVKMLAEELARRQKKVAVLSRGYGSDENVFLKEILKPVPVLVGRNRIKNAGAAIENYGAEVLILDDGFQQWRLARDLDIVTINSRNPFGNGHLLPRGILREPLSALRRADVFFLTRADADSKDRNRLRQKLRALNPEALIVEAVYTPAGLYHLSDRGRRVEPKVLAGEKVALLAGIADPESFRRRAEVMGLKVVVEFFFPDHYQYQMEDFFHITVGCTARKAGAVITTEKDAVKLRKLLWELDERQMSSVEIGLRKILLTHLGPVQFLVMPIEIKIISNEEEFFNRLFGVVDN